MVNQLPMPHFHVGIREQKQAWTRRIVGGHDNPAQVFGSFEAAEERLRSHVGGAVMSGFTIRRVEESSVLLRGWRRGDPPSTRTELFIRLKSCRVPDCGAGRSKATGFWIAPPIDG